MRILPEMKFSPTMVPAEAARIVNVSKIVESIDKANRVLTNLKAAHKPNKEAIATWECINAALRFRWDDAMVEVSSNGRYSFE